MNERDFLKPVPRFRYNFFLELNFQLPNATVCANCPVTAVAALRFRSQIQFEEFKSKRHCQSWKTSAATLRGEIGPKRVEFPLDTKNYLNDIEQDENHTHHAPIAIEQLNDQPSKHNGIIGFDGMELMFVHDAAARTWASTNAKLIFMTADVIQLNWLECACECVRLWVSHRLFGMSSSCMSLVRR